MSIQLSIPFPAFHLSVCQAVAGASESSSVSHAIQNREGKAVEAGQVRNTRKKGWGGSQTLITTSAKKDTGKAKDEKGAQNNLERNRSKKEKGSEYRINQTTKTIFDDYKTVIALYLNLFLSGTEIICTFYVKSWHFLQ